MTEIIAHRGGAILWPENSLMAFRGAIAAGVDAVECDVHLSADGEVMVMHDPTLDRTSNGRGTVAARSAEQLSETKLISAGGEGVPRLSELVGLVAPSRSGMQLEIKLDAAGHPYPGILDRVLAELDQGQLRARTELIVFEAEMAAAGLAAGGFRNVAWLFAPATLAKLGIGGVLAVVRHIGVGMVETHEAVMDAELLAALRGAGLRVGAWGVNHAASIERMLGLGLDAIATDDPVLAMKMRGR
ncbi:glycerophosphodiester phosphodiesterase [Roseomonas xinghualingensis]|uniref:glycerophosphodiester phosphodiesterase n=1 Tax=Roseomonas xinghualingensis TaxID=2986475 RepID=UPI0021F17662|nr:glycerophosphodiester phosphodiesterase family protein [Roseomonas sp. SXEYE001]MCV4208655.1 glycerophosphodiester phosphodiesterase family protein [Roseomonas sp. SXEYE001]